MGAAPSRRRTVQAHSTAAHVWQGVRVTPADLATACRDAQEALGDLVQRALFGDGAAREEAARVLVEVQRVVRAGGVKNENVSAIDMYPELTPSGDRDHVIPRVCKRRSRGTSGA